MTDKDWLEVKGIASVLVAKLSQGDILTLTGGFPGKVEYIEILDASQWGMIGEPTYVSNGIVVRYFSEHCVCRSEPLEAIDSFSIIQTDIMLDAAKVLLAS